MQITKEIKRHSSRWIKSLGIHYSKFAWQGGYGAFSVSPSVVERTKRYIENQENRHKEHGYQEELLILLEAYKIDYDPAFLFND